MNFPLWNVILIIFVGVKKRAIRESFLLTAGVLQAAIYAVPDLWKVGVMGEERRRYARYVVKLPVILHSHDGLEAVAVNLSYGGVLLLGDFTFADWEEVRLELRFPCGRALLVSSCVCWSDCGLAGLQFNGLNAETQGFIDEFLEQLSRQDGGE